MTKHSTSSLRALAAGMAALASLGLTGCDVPGAGNWRTESRCQPPGGGLAPEQVLPDPKKCPEAYKGNGNGNGNWAPGVPEWPGTTEPYRPGPTPPCSTVPSLNGFRCENVDPWGNPGPYYP